MKAEHKTKEQLMNQELSIMKEKLRKTGIDIIGDAPWGTHFCLFYQTKNDLIDILVPYFKAGLKNNELCIWVTSEHLDEKEAKRAMRTVVPNFDQYLKRGQIEIIPHTQWYLKDGAVNLKIVLNALIDKLNQALSRGYDGIRVTGNTAWLDKRDWKSFTDYEEEVNDSIGKYQMIAICTYCLDKCGASEVIDVVSNHRFALIKREGEWELIESSERKQVEEALRESEEKFDAMLRSIGDHMSMMDRDLNIIWANETAKKIFGNDIIGKKCYEAYHRRKEPCEPYLCLTLKAFQDGKVHEHDTQVIDKDGKIIYFHCTANVALRDKEGKPTAVIEISRDITEYKRAEEQIQASLREKDVLLKEVHHRVKNNLQVISSLLDMSSMRTYNQQAINLFRDARTKIHTMALIHAQLYQSDRFDQIDMGRQVRELVSYLLQVYATRKISITPVIEDSGVYLSVTQAIPCALVLNEVISNAFRHAFREGQKGMVEISMQRSAHDTLFITVKDDGIGIPEEIDIHKTESLGLKLVRNLVQHQLKGKIQVERDNGTKFIVEFKVLKEEVKGA